MQRALPLLTAALLLLAAPSAHAAFKFLHDFGSNGTLAGQFQQPTRAAVDSDGTVYVADRTNNRVQVFDADGVFVRQINGGGTLLEPQDVAIGPDDNLYVTDGQNHRVHVMTKLGVHVRFIGAGPSSGLGQLDEPQGVDVDPVTGQVYVAEEVNRRVSRFSALGVFEIIGAMPSQGSPGVPFAPFPSGLALRGGDLYVADRANDRIQRWNKADLSFAAFVGPSLRLLQDLAFDTAGSLFAGHSVSNPESGAVSRLDPATGVVLERMTAGLDAVTGVAVSGSGRLAVVELLSDRVSVYDIQRARVTLVDGRLTYTGTPGGETASVTQDGNQFRVSSTEGIINDTGGACTQPQGSVLLCPATVTHVAADTLEGDDTFTVALAQVVSDLRGGPGSDQLAASALGSILDGGDGSDTLTGNAGDDALSGGAGADVMRGAGGGDTLDGGDGDDTLEGFDGADHLIGAAGNDVLVGETGDDSLEGGDGNDTLNGSDGQDLLEGGPGDDGLTGAGGSDRLVGGAGTDGFAGGDGNDALLAQDGVAEDVDCGTGADEVTSDALDRLIACETRITSTLDPTQPGPVAIPSSTARIEPGVAVSVGGRRTGRIIRRLRLIVVPRGSVVTVRCRSARGARRANRCPFTSKSVTVRAFAEDVDLTSRFKRRKLKPGTRIEITITKPSTIGYFLRLTLRASGPPQRARGCIPVGAKLSRPTCS